jgi:thiol-disulfide isomerase/thioredoxin
MALPILAEVAKLYEDKGVVFVAVNIEGVGPAVIQNFLQSKDLDIKVGVDEKQLAAGNYRVGPIPQTVIVGKEGVVQTVHLGMAPNLREQLSQELETLLAGKNLYD